MLTRVALVIAAVCLLGAGLATFLPTSPQGATCGTWVAPEWTDEGVAELTAGIPDMTVGDLTNEFTGEINRDLAGIGAAAVTAKRLCDDALSTRRTTTIVLLVLAVAVPAGVVFIGSARRRED